MIGLLASLIVATGADQRTPDPPRSSTERQRYRAVLSSPGGELPFGLELARADGVATATLINGSERIEVPIARWDGKKLMLGLEHYDATIEAVSTDIGKPSAPFPRRLRGRWRKRSGVDTWSQLDFSARPWEGYRFEPMSGGKATEAGGSVDGRWLVRFSESHEPAIGLFRQATSGSVEGTFLTTTGDYRFLAGSFERGRLRLSSFDGAHAFLFDARLLPDGTLAGDFWSRDTWHETWTARRDDSASLSDAFERTDWKDGVALADLKFPDLDGRVRSLDEPEFRGRGRIIEVFGSWCPNCHDASAFLAELERRYRDRGLRVLGIAFELTGDPERDAAQVRIFARRHGVEYPILLGGLSDKATAGQALPVLDRLRAYPTTIFLRGDGSVRAVHTGFSGPATGSAHEKLRRRFEALVEELLKDEPGGS